MTTQTFMTSSLAILMTRVNFDDVVDYNELPLIVSLVLGREVGMYEIIDEVVREEYMGILTAQFPDMPTEAAALEDPAAAYTTIKSIYGDSVEVQGV